MNLIDLENPDWSPFSVNRGKKHGDEMRSIKSIEGITDRIRAAAFAELQAREAFLWASERFLDAHEALRQGWRMLAKAEDKHLRWLLGRLEELGAKPSDREVSDFLWLSLISCTSGKQFALYIAHAEERGRKAGVRFYESLRNTDPKTATIFQKIAEEEVEHIDLAFRFYPEEKNPRPLDL